jgi:hypothetical protein
MQRYGPADRDEPVNAASTGRARCNVPDTLIDHLMCTANRWIGCDHPSDEIADPRLRRWPP